MPLPRLKTAFRVTSVSSSLLMLGLLSLSDVASADGKAPSRANGKSTDARTNRAAKPARQLAEAQGRELELEPRQAPPPPPPRPKKTRPFGTFEGY